MGYKHSACGTDRQESAQSNGPHRNAAPSLSVVLQERVKWGFEPPSVGLPFDWHLPTYRLERAAAAAVSPKELTGKAKACVPFQASTHSPYALVCSTKSESLKEMTVHQSA